jgi:hypothetical protein
MSIQEGGRRVSGWWQRIGSIANAQGSGDDRRSSREAPPPATCVIPGPVAGRNPESRPDLSQQGLDSGFAAVRRPGMTMVAGRVARCRFGRYGRDRRDRRGTRAVRYALVAQLDRASDFESEGREFESLRARQSTISERLVSMHGRLSSSAFSQPAGACGYVVDTPFVVFFASRSVRLSANG